MSNEKSARSFAKRVMPAGIVSRKGGGPSIFLDDAPVNPAELDDDGFTFEDPRIFPWEHHQNLGSLSNDGKSSKDRWLIESGLVGHIMDSAVNQAVAEASSALPSVTKEEIEQYFAESPKPLLVAARPVLVRPSVRVSARELRMPDEYEWLLECTNVLRTVGWAVSGTLTKGLLHALEESEGRNLVDRAKDKHGSNWRPYLLDMAAKNFAEPLSRTWYAASLPAIYYCYQDDLRFGTLWAEYQFRLSHEMFAVKHLEERQNKAAWSTRGGDATSAARKELYAICDGMMQRRKNELFAVDPGRWANQLRVWAKEHDQAEKFYWGTNFRSEDWFDAYLSDWRLRQSPKKA